MHQLVVVHGSLLATIDGRAPPRSLCTPGSVELIEGQVGAMPDAVGEDGGELGSLGIRQLQRRVEDACGFVAHAEQCSATVPGNAKGSM